MKLLDEKKKPKTFDVNSKILILSEIKEIHIFLKKTINSFITATVN